MLWNDKVIIAFRRVRVFVFETYLMVINVL